MATVEQRPAAVRVELATEDGMVAPPSMEPSRSHGSPNGAIGALALVLLALAALLWAMRPDEGQTAAGTPITVSTSVPDPTDASARASDAEDAVARTTTTMSEGEGIPDTERGYETVEANSHLLSIVPAELGWIALGFPYESTSPALLRSVDGLNWTRFLEETLPDGDLLGFDRLGDTFMLAVDEKRSWSESSSSFELDQYPDHRISVWTSIDGVAWAPSEFPSVEGNGYPSPVSFTNDSYTLSLVGLPEDPLRVLIDYLSPFVDESRAGLVCSSRRTFETDVRTVELLDCDGSLVAEVRELDFPDDFGRVWPSTCVEAARALGSQGFQSVFVERGGAPVAIEQPAGWGRSDMAVPGGFISHDQGSRFGLRSDCAGSKDRASSRSALRYWTESTGLVDVSPTASGPIDELQGWGLALTRGIDDRFFVTMSGSVWASAAPFDDWEEVLEPPIDGVVRSNSVFNPLMLSSDGRHALHPVPGILYLAELGDEWMRIPFDSRGEFIQIVVATDDFVVVRVQGSSTERLVKVPLP